MVILQLSSKRVLFGSLLSKALLCFSICSFSSTALVVPVYADQYSDYGVQLYNSIPFTRHGRHLAVEIEGDAGRKTNMLVDTGAEGIGMTMANIKALGIEIPADAQKTRSSGVGGTADGFGFVVDSLRLGPIIKRNVRIDVTTSEDGMLGTNVASMGCSARASLGTGGSLSTTLIAICAFSIKII